MSTLTTTIIVAFVITLIAIALLSISWLFTGKSNLRSGACGRDPNQKRSDDCSQSGSCDLCERQNPSNEKKQK